jgi:hypothetical protein
MQVFWSHDGKSLFSEARSEYGSTKYILVVEPLPGKQRWDWSVWQKNQAAVRYGVAPSIMTAIADAEAASRRWDSESISMVAPDMAQ